jgi:hypothetical protein
LPSRRPNRPIVACANRVKKWGETIGDRSRITPHQAPYEQLARMVVSGAGSTEANRSVFQG